MGKLHCNFQRKTSFIMLKSKCKLEGSAMEEVKTCRERENEHNRA